MAGGGRHKFDICSKHNQLASSITSVTSSSSPSPSSSLATTSLYYRLLSVRMRSCCRIGCTIIIKLKYLSKYLPPAQITITHSKSYACTFTVTWHWLHYDIQQHMPIAHIHSFECTVNRRSHFERYGMISQFCKSYYSSARPYGPHCGSTILWENAQHSKAVYSAGLLR